MRIDYPAPAQIPKLRGLWKDAFGDDDAFLDLFFSTAFSPYRCRCVTEGEQVTAALYWFDCECMGQKLAYLYAVATASSHRGRGLCRSLMEDTRLLLGAQGYGGILLVPENEPLIQMYGKMGYSPCTFLREFRAAAAGGAIPMKQVTAEEYASLRRKLLPPGGVIQERENLRYLGAQAEFWAGDGFAAAITRSGNTLHCHELLPQGGAAGQIVQTLGCKEGFFRVPGLQKPFAMYRALVPGAEKPAYFGLAFD